MVRFTLREANGNSGRKWRKRERDTETGRR